MASDFYTLTEILILGISVLICIYITMIAINANKKNKYLCDDCRFNNENDCNKAERPKAEICFSYSANISQNQ